MSLAPVRLLLLLSALLAGGLAWLWFDQAGAMRNVTWVAPAPLNPALGKVASAQPGAAVGNPTQYLAMLERPLFAPDRRPPPPPAPPAPPAAPPPPDPLANVQISGIFSGAIPGIIARVDGKLRRVKVNETIGPWTLKSIEGRDVTFAQGTENRQLRLLYSRLGPPVVQAAAPNAPAAQLPAGQPSGNVASAPNPQDEGRERLRRVNAIRVANGMQPLRE
jgi:hypothetical protein